MAVKSERHLSRRLSAYENLISNLDCLQKLSNNSFIVSATLSSNLIPLEDFNITYGNNGEIILLGVFTSKNIFHIGNNRFNGSNLLNKYAVFEMLIDDRNYYSKVAAKKVIIVFILWLQDNYDAKTIKLGVAHGNLSALILYLKLGLKKIDEIKAGGDSLAIKLKELSEI
jgi:hypothetical protein